MTFEKEMVEKKYGDYEKPIYIYKDFIREGIMQGHIKKIKEIIVLFLYKYSVIIVTFAEFVIEKCGISEYMMRDEKRVINQIIKNVSNVYISDNVCRTYTYFHKISKNGVI